MKRLIILLSICLAPAIFLDADAQVKVYVDSMTVNYLDEGAMADDRLMVVAKEAYDTLGLDRKNDILDAVADDFPASEVVLTALWYILMSGIWTTLVSRISDLCSLTAAVTAA